MREALGFNHMATGRVSEGFRMSKSCRKLIEWKETR